jgi:hypothetical protein
MTPAGLRAVGALHELAEEVDPTFGPGGGASRGDRCMGIQHLLGYFLHDHFADTADRDSRRVDPAKAGSGVIGWLTTCSRG